MGSKRPPRQKSSLGLNESIRQATLSLVPQPPPGPPDYARDPVRFIDAFITVNEHGKPFRLFPFQREILTTVFRFDPETGTLPWHTFIYSCPKKSGKTTLNAALTCWWMMTQEAPNEGFVLANDEEQARSRVFNTVRKLVRRNEALHKSVRRAGTNKIRFTNDSELTAIASDYASASGSDHGLSSWDEIWAYVSERAQRLWEEVGPVPTRTNSIRIVTSYAGWADESDLLFTIYKQVVDQSEHPSGQGTRIHRDLPIFFNETTKTIAYWDHVPRCPWQTPQYYAAEKASLRPSTYLRLHQNQWTTSEERFLTPLQVEPIFEKDLTPQQPNRKLPLYCGLDLGIKHDNAAFIAVSPDQEGNHVIARHRLWRPTPGHSIELQAIEDYIDAVAVQYDVRVVYLDPWQGIGMAQRLSKRGINVLEFPQSQGNTIKMGSALWDAVIERRLRSYLNDDIREHLLNAVAVESDRGFRIAKDKASKKIDLAVALSLALVASVETGATPPGPSLEELETLNDSEQRFQREYMAHMGGNPETLNPLFVEDDLGDNYEGRDMTPTRVGPDGVRRPVGRW